MRDNPIDVHNLPKFMRQHDNAVPLSLRSSIPRGLQCVLALAAQNIVCCDTVFERIRAEQENVPGGAFGSLQQCLHRSD